MARIAWSPQAIADLEAIQSYIARDSEHYAVATIDRILYMVDSLESFPSSGRIVPELGNPKVRELLFGNYRIVYNFGEELVQILTVYHASRLLHLEE